MRICSVRRGSSPPSTCRARAAGWSTNESKETISRPERRSNYVAYDEEKVGGCPWFEYWRRFVALNSESRFPKLRWTKTSKTQNYRWSNQAGLSPVSLQPTPICQLSSKTDSKQVAESLRVFESHWESLRVNVRFIFHVHFMFVSCCLCHPVPMCCWASRKRHRRCWRSTNWAPDYEAVARGGAKVGAKVYQMWLVKTMFQVMKLFKV